MIYIENTSNPIKEAMQNPNQNNIKPKMHLENNINVGIQKSKIQYMIDLQNIHKGYLRNLGS